MDIAAIARDIARDIAMAGSYQEPAKQPLSPVQLSPDTWQRAVPILATGRRTLPVGNPIWRKWPAAHGAGQPSTASGSGRGQGQCCWTMQVDTAAVPQP